MTWWDNNIPKKWESVDYFCIVQYEDGSEKCYGSTTKDFFESAKKAGWDTQRFEVDAKKHIWRPQEHVFIPDTHIECYVSAPAFSSCVYSAIDTFIASMLGRKFDSSDRVWAAAHPLAEKDGVALHNVPSFAQAVLEPYSIGVKRIWVPRGQAVIEPELAQWMDVLMRNPLALKDMRSTNEEAAVALNLPKDAFDGCGFEYADKPGRPCIMASAQDSVVSDDAFAKHTGAVWSNGASLSFDHADYVAPRAIWPSESWEIAIQLAPLSECRYAVEPKLPEYKPRAGLLSPKVDTAKGKDGKLLRVEKSPIVYSGGRQWQPTYPKGNMGSGGGWDNDFGYGW